MNRAQEAINYYERALAIAEEIGERREQAINLWKLALAAEVRVDCYSSIQRAELARCIFDEIGGGPTDLIKKKIKGWKVSGSPQDPAQ